MLGKKNNSAMDYDHKSRAFAQMADNLDDSALISFGVNCAGEDSIDVSMLAGVEVGAAHMGVGRGDPTEGPSWGRKPA